MALFNFFNKKKTTQVQQSETKDKTITDGLEKVRIVGRAGLEQKIKAIRAIRAYTMPFYSLEQAESVLSSIPCEIYVSNAEAFYSDMKASGFIVEGDGLKERVMKSSKKIDLRIMTSQLLAFYLATKESKYKDEYLRRLKMCGASNDAIQAMYRFEMKILQSHDYPELLKIDFIQRKLFTLNEPFLPHDISYYETNIDYPLSYIVKISDEAEWHYWNSHEWDLKDDVWDEIFNLADRNKKLFLPFAIYMVEKLGWTVQQVNNYSYNEQGLLEIFRWGKAKSSAASNPWNLN